MATSYESILRESALRINAIAGSVPSTLESNYTTSPLTSTQVVSSIFPLDAITDAILDVEGRLAWAIADCRQHPWRQFFSDAIVDLPNFSTLPAVAFGGSAILGAWGEVREAGSGTVCSEMPLDQVRRAASLRDAGFLTVQPFWFNITGGELMHTMDLVDIVVCIYKRDTQAAVLAGGGNILLPDSLVQAYIAGTVATLVRDDEFTGQAAMYANYFQNALENISKGLTLVNGIPQIEVAA